MEHQDGPKERSTEDAVAVTIAPPVLPADTPDIQLNGDPEIRRRVAMAAESDLEAFRYAHWRGTVTFHDVASSWFHMSDPNLPDALRAEFKTLFPGLLDAFAEPRKGIITAYFCRHIRVAAALTDISYAAGAPEGVPEAALKGPPPAGIRAILEQQVASEANGHADPRPGASAWRWPRRSDDGVSFWQRLLPGGPRIFEPVPAASSAIHIEPTFGDPEDWKAKELLFQCLHLHYKALEFLPPQPRKICLRMIFGVITTLLGTLDHRQIARDTEGLPERPFGSDPAEVETLERELAQAKVYYEASAQRQAQLEYLVGMVMFLVPAVAGTVAAAIIERGVLNEAAIVSVLGGAAGAVVSVMNRMTSGRLKVRQEAGRNTIRALGFMRPVIGATFGAVVYLLLEGHIVELLPSSAGNNLAFYAALGFMSGFSERFAEDVIAHASREQRPAHEQPAPKRS